MLGQSNLLKTKKNSLIRLPIWPKGVSISLENKNALDQLSRVLFVSTTTKKILLRIIRYTLKKPWLMDTVSIYANVIEKKRERERFNHWSWLFQKWIRSHIKKKQIENKLAEPGKKWERERGREEKNYGTILYFIWDRITNWQQLQWSNQHQTKKQKLRWFLFLSLSLFFGYECVQITYESSLTIHMHICILL